MLRPLYPSISSTSTISMRLFSCVCNRRSIGLVRKAGLEFWPVQVWGQRTSIECNGKSSHYFYAKPERGLAWSRKIWRVDRIKG